MFNTILPYIDSLNTSKYFTGVVMIMLNIGSRYIELGLSKSMEDFIKYNVARELIIFSMAWMGTRDIIVALTLTAVFVILSDFLLNADSKFCVLSSTQLKNMLDSNKDGMVSDKEIADALEILEKAKKQKDYQKSINLVNYYHDLK